MLQAQYIFFDKHVSLADIPIENSVLIGDKSAIIVVA
jgi:hypothetical protein